MAANRVMASITKWLEDHLRVQVNVAKTKVTRPNDIKYLGHSFYFKENQWRPKPHLKSVNKLKYKLVPLLRRNWGVAMEYRIKKINEVTRGWINYFRICDMKTVMMKLDSWIRKHIRMIYWKQWKTVRNRANHLYRLGMPLHYCWQNANTRKSLARTARWLGSLITNDILKRSGLLCLTDHYVVKHSFQILSLEL